SSRTTRPQIGPTATPAQARAGEGAVMRKQMIENAAYAVATQIRTVEDSIEAALAELAELQATMVRARPVTRVGYTTIQSAFENIADATQGLIAARGEVGHCHVALADAKQTM